MRVLSRSSLVRSGISAALLSALLVACGSSGGGGGTATGGSGTATSGSCPSQSISGVVTFSQFISPTAFNDVSASFDAQPFTGSVDFGCHAACTFFPRQDGGAIPDAGPMLDVGSITVTDVTTRSSQMVPALGLDYFDMSFSWAAGDMLQIAGAGNGAFPAFSISFASPSALTVTSPTEIAAKQTVVASQAAGLTIAWEPASPAATFMSVGMNSPAGEIDCYPADSAGTVTISPSVLSNIPVGTYSEGLSVGRWVTAVDAFGGKNIALQAQEIASATVQVTP